LYLDFISLENQHFCLTANKSGFFLNESKKNELNIKHNG